MNKEKKCLTRKAEKELYLAIVLCSIWLLFLVLLFCYPILNMGINVVAIYNLVWFIIGLRGVIAIGRCKRCIEALN